MAPIAVCRQGGVVIVGMAGSASQSCMRAGKGKYRVVIERGGAPAAGGVADGAIGGKTLGGVIGVGCSVKVRLVAGVARRRRRRKVIVGVALRAGQRGVNSRQGIVGIESVIKSYAGPIRCGVA